MTTLLEPRTVSTAATATTTATATSIAPATMPAATAGDRRRLLLGASSSLLLAACGGGDLAAEDLAALSDDDWDELADTLDRPATVSTATDADRLRILFAEPTGVAVNRHWTLELPVNRDGDLRGRPLAVDAPFDVPEAGRAWFRREGRSIWMAAPPFGATTSDKAGGARCEFKQRDDDDVRWDARRATRSMTLAQTLLRTPRGRKPRVVVGQVHDAEENLILVRYVGPEEARGTGDTGRIAVAFNYRDKKGVFTLDPAYTLGTAMRLTIGCADGVGFVHYRRAGLSCSASHTLRPRSGGNTSYFKFGAYTQRKGLSDTARTGHAELRVTGMRVD